ncbi:hypothetical protein M9Y10_019226 [Tritrichomonas musculus]|uniref:Caspase family p20 domain-containing protein n=1 Tax=Tritrichomonas musculus TaxID=1915356 RepID=A0ABR2HJ21_9EUKA
MSYVDTPGKKQKHPHYEHQTSKLEKKDNHFSSKKFHHIRKVSTHKELIKSFGRIGMCLNDKQIHTIPVGDLNKVCFILVNDYDMDYEWISEENKNRYVYKTKEEKKVEKIERKEMKRKELGVGPLNDGYLVGLKHHRLGFKVFYLYNTKCEQFTNYLEFFIKHTTKSLTVYYSGRGNNEGIEFNNNAILKKEMIKNIISNNYNNEAATHIVLISENYEGGNLFEFEKENGSNKNIITLSVQKCKNIEKIDKENKRSHGIFTYYLCKMIAESPNITPKRLKERIEISLSRFNETIICECSNGNLYEAPIFPTN